jgi:hypothetical protein
MQTTKEMVKSNFLTASKQFAENNPDTSMFNINDLKEYVLMNYQDMSISLERTYFANDIIQHIGGDNVFDSEGYIEDDDDTPKKIRDYDSDIVPALNRTSDGKIILSKEDDITKVLNSNTEERKYCLEYIQEIIDDKLIYIINKVEILAILNYFYEQLNSGLIELSDNFVEERRKYFQTDYETYISIVKHFLEKKDDFFACVLNDIMNKLSITQSIIDASFHYYLEVADILDSNVEEIRISYNKLFNAGVK